MGSEREQMVEKPYAYCCNGDPAACDCVRPDHGTAFYQAVCTIPNCRNRAPADEAFCSKHRTTSLAAQDGLVDRAKLRDAIEAAITQRAIEIIRGDNESDLHNCLEQYAEVATAAALASIGEQP